MGGVSIIFCTYVNYTVEFKMHLNRRILNVAAVLKVNIIVRYFSL